MHHGDWIGAEGLGQAGADWTAINGMADDAAADAGFGLDERLCHNSHGEEPVPESSRLRGREIPVVRQLEDLVQHFETEPAVLDKYQWVIRGSVGCIRLCVCRCRMILLCLDSCVN